MTRYKIRVYEATALGFFTQADHYEDYFMESSETLREIAKRLMTEGFQTDSGRKWIMPTSILTAEIDSAI